MRAIPFVVFPACLAAVLAVGGPALAQDDYPSKPIRLITPAAQGGTTDILARVFGAKLSEAFKQQVLVDNRASASGVIAGEMVANAPPDGYTLLLAYHQHTVNAALNAKLPYHPVHNFTPVTQLTSAGLMLVVHPSAPPKTLAEFIEWTKNFKGAGPAMMDLVAGQYHYNFSGLQGAQTLIRGGKLRGLAITTPRRVAALPDVPAVAEALPGFEVVGWYGVIGPANLPRPIVTRLHAELIRVLNAPDIRERIVADGSEPVGSSPEEFRQFMLADLAKWAKVVKESGAKTD
jgi:tripartite-type tricarboxylate transporter receptor subunit TctC